MTLSQALRNTDGTTSPKAFLEGRNEYVPGSKPSRSEWAYEVMRFVAEDADSDRPKPG